ncbi:MAG: DUF5684 domain-containing protein [Propionicimonas sp.]
MTPDDNTLTAGLLVPLMITALVLSVVMIIAAWKVFAKAGEPGWASLIPFYNTYVEFRIAGFNPWLFLLLLVPVVNIVLALIVSYKVGENFGKGVLFNVFGMVIFPVVGWLILGFGSATYRRPVTV